MPDSSKSAAARNWKWRPARERAGDVLRLPAPRRKIPGARTISAAERRKLEALRMIGLKSSLACRPACLMNCAPNRRPGEDCSFYCAGEQFRVFVEIADRRIMLYRPGAKAVSPDEEWLLRLTAAISDGDMSAATALAAFRLEKNNRRSALARASALACCLNSLAKPAPEDH